MKKRRIFKLTGLIITFLIALFLETITAIFFDIKLFVGELIVFFILAVFSYYRIKRQSKDAEEYIADVINNLNGGEKSNLSNLKMAVLATAKQGEIVWYNETFKSTVIGGNHLLGRNISEMLKKEMLETLETDGLIDIKINKNYYTIYKNAGENKSFTDIYYFIDITAFKMITNEYKRSRPVVAIIVIDNISDILKNAKESEKAVLKGEIENMLEKWASDSTGFLRKIDHNKFIMVIEERHLKKYTDDNFDILNKVRNLKTLGLGGATLSIGIGKDGKSLYENENMAEQALDMALGRGGDHVAIKSGNNFEFFGGLSNGAQRVTKVKTRVIASSLKERITESDTILIMGHKFGDLDSVGASIGIWKTAKSFGKEAFVVTNKNQSLAKMLVTQFESRYPDAVINSEDAVKLVTSKTLLIIVDTHRPEFLEFKELYQKCENVVVIDHHRKTVEHITNAIIFFHEPNASSTSEMITEMLPYMGNNLIGRFEADALLSGIMLDTKNFVIHTGVRTFEAAAYLRNVGADPVNVKQLFSSSMSTYKLKTSIVASAEQYGSAAISFAENGQEDVRIASAQAADELLLIEGIKAAYVIFATDNTINISARSLGEVNVQFVMEEFGGGGHQTMAAAQLEHSNFEEARTKLCVAIDKYNRKNKKIN